MGSLLQDINMAYTLGEVIYDNRLGIDNRSVGLGVSISNRFKPNCFYALPNCIPLNQSRSNQTVRGISKLKTNSAKD